MSEPKTYTFGTITKTLKKNTFENEELVKDSIGANEKNEQRILAINKEFQRLSKEYGSKPNKKRKAQIEQRIAEINAEVIELTQGLEWSKSFEMCLKVMDVLFVEGSVGLTKSNFGRFDAQEVWSDFFSPPKPIDED
jgi:hypothetical protein